MCCSGGYAMISTDLQSSFPPTHLGRRWHTSTFRWLSVYALVFAVSCMSLLGYIEHSVTQAMEREADSGIRWQLRYFDTLDDPELSTIIARRIEHEQLHSDYYGFFTADGRHIAGDIETIPHGLRLDDVRETHSLFDGQTLALEQDYSTPMVRAIGERRYDGTQLVVARDLADVMHIRDEL